MKISYRTLIILLFLICAGRARAQNGAPSPVVRIGETQKVCQLTGDIDWETGRRTAARTLTNFGLDATDLGYPVDHNGKLVLLFGDSWPPPHGNGPLAEVIPDDSVGVTTRTELPNPETCLDLTVHSKTEGGKKKFDPATITGPVKVKQGFFNVPSGGVSVEGSLYGFFWTDHCSQPNPLTPAPNNPLERPAPTANCPETNERSSIGRGVMARSDDTGHTFTRVTAMPEGFVYSTAVNARIQHDLPEEQNLGVFIFGVPRYRKSVPYLAYAPIETFSDPETWRFFSGRTPEGRPRWVPKAEWKPGPANQIYPPASGAEYNVGEFSVTWNRPLRMWLMMYGGVAVRVAPAPWGPWSEPTVILGPADRPGCKFVMTVEGCGNRRDYWPSKRHGDKFQPGGFYAPYVMNRYTRADAEPRRATIFWTLSTWNPYEVSIMRTTIELPRPVVSPRPTEGPRSSAAPTDVPTQQNDHQAGGVATHEIPPSSAEAPPQPEEHCIGGVCPNASTGVTVYRPNRELCKVTNSLPNVGGKNDLLCRFDMAAADTGAFVRDGQRTWVLFGDAAPGDSSAWAHGADPTGYFDGLDPAAGLCNDLKLLAARGMRSRQTCARDPQVFAPQVVIGPAWNEPIHNFFFQPVEQPAGAPPLPPNSAIPGVDEGATGAFSYEGRIYAFYMASQGPSSPGHLPIPNVSSLAIWDHDAPSASPYPAIFRIVSKVDYVPSAQGVPAGWPVSPPLGEKFVQIAPVRGTDGYLYIFGTGQYRKSFVYLARMPISNVTSVRQYLWQTPGFEVWTGTGWSATDPTSATPLPFPDGMAPDVGEFSVEYFPRVGLWLMMTEGPSGIIARWALAPTGPWSKQIVVLDMAQVESQQMYCCQGKQFRTDKTLDLPMWACVKDEGGRVVDEPWMVECVRAASPKIGTPRYGLYAPYMVPFVTNVSSSSYTADGKNHVVNRFEVSYMLSAFSPYDRILMSYQLQSDTVADFGKADNISSTELPLPKR